jgi:predicted ATP-binding protein involved in virulence
MVTENGRNGQYYTAPLPWKQQEVDACDWQKSKSKTFVFSALVGENDSGKTAIVDAIRLVLGTRGQAFFRVGDADFHQPSDGTAIGTCLN